MIKARSGCCCCSGWIECAVMALASPVQRSRLVGGKFVVWFAMALRTALWWLCCCPVHFPVRWGWLIASRITPERLWMVYKRFSVQRWELYRLTTEKPSETALSSSDGSPIMTSM